MEYFEQIKSKTILIVDDDVSFSDLLNLMLQNIGFQHIIVANFYEAAWDIITTKKIDLILLDVMLDKGRTGIELAKQLQTIKLDVPVIFMTVNYSSKVYESAKITVPFSFMSKDISELRLRQAVELPLLNVFKSNQAEHSAKTVPPIENAPPQSCFIKVRNEYKTIFFKDIDYIYSHLNGSFIHSGNREYPTNKTLKEWETKILASNFLRIHQTYIVNIDKIQSINIAESYITIEGKKLPIGVTYRKNISKHLLLIK